MFMSAFISRKTLLSKNQSQSNRCITNKKNYFATTATTATFRDWDDSMPLWRDRIRFFWQKKSWWCSFVAWQHSSIPDNGLTSVEGMRWSRIHLSLHLEQYRLVFEIWNHPTDVRPPPNLIKAIADFPVPISFEQSVKDC